ncbi:ArsR/SmtB family transcription factor [Marivita hallyeonensis]|uniref:Transcriptional regulator, ArsR family n=1 Tax=Marivita hallyeonensis TaxID=996342 RepID=A0A1M5WBI9_9RHOB|nr:metalloregulator ArsR/SmtB family transcription factor [Marivita hallyeonensis]SHH84820.1 transcriptional regulator, ArsR family [Marivita hallyeonensis]
MTDAQQLGFRALSDPTRRRILQLLAREDLTIAEVAENFQMTRAAVKKHLAILNEGHLIKVETVGRTRRNSLDPDGLRRVYDWFGFFDQFWDDRLNALKSEIEKDVQ